MDGFDSLLMAPPKELRDKFVGSGYDVVWAKNMQRIPDNDVGVGTGEEGSSGSSWLHTYAMRTMFGCNGVNCAVTAAYVGYAASVADVIDDYLPADLVKCDQRLVNTDLTPLVVRNHAVDWDNQLFVVTETDYHVVGAVEKANSTSSLTTAVSKADRYPRYVVAHSDAQPCVLALNEASYATHKRSLQELGYGEEAERLRLVDFVAEFLEKVYHQVWPLMWRDLTAMILMVLTTGFLAFHDRKAGGNSSSSSSSHPRHRSQRRG